MNVLLTSTSFFDTPGAHMDKLNSLGFNIDYIPGPVKEKVLIPIISKYDGIICGDDEITKNVISNGVKGKLKVISKYGIGLDKIDIEFAKEINLKICNTPGVNHITVSEHILALLLTYYKNIHKEYNFTRSGVWKRLIGHEIYGKKVGIIGFGRIGKETAKRTKALGMKTYVYDPFAKISKKYFYCKSLTDLVKEIDVMVLTLPLNKKTRGLIDKKLILKASKKLVIINTSRANIIDQNSLIQLLKEDKIEAYLTDVMDEEPMPKKHILTKFDNVLITPHIGSRTYQSVERQGIKAVNNLLKHI